MIKSQRKKFLMSMGNSKQAIFLKVSLSVFVLGLILFVYTTLFSGVEIVKAQEVEWIPPVGNSIMEVHIANNGMTFLQGARVDSISETTILVSTVWNLTKLEWTIFTNGSSYGQRHFGTSLLDSKGNYVVIKSIQVGDIISITGTLDMTQSGPVIKADTIRISN